MKRILILGLMLLISFTGGVYIYFKCEPVEPEQTIVTIQPLGTVDQLTLSECKRAITNYYGFTVHINDPISFPKSAYVNVKSPRYRADTLIRFLRRTKPDSVDYVCGITEADISTTKYDHWPTKSIKKPEYKYTDWGVCGLGFRPGEANIVSTFRLKGQVSKSKLNERLRKVVCHELGHNLSLSHCDSSQCFMRDAAETVKTIDQVNEHLCSSCQKKVNWYLQLTN